MNFVAALAAFNRKERYWLLRNALGQGAESLGTHFREKLGKEIGEPIPEDAWWAIDYHLDWLAGAFHIAENGFDDRTTKDNNNRLITGTQEDIDLIIAFNQTLILVEAKGDTSWGNKQFQSKVRRLKKLLELQEDGKDNREYIQSFLVLTSPRRPVRLRPEHNEGWPDWMMKNKENPYWIELGMSLDGNQIADGKTDFRKVVRCIDDKGTVGKTGSHWKVV